MTEYGRGPGSQPWHPEDPLYGDRAWDGAQQSSWDSYGGQQQPQEPYYPQQPQHPQHPQQPQEHQQTPYGNWDGSQGGTDQFYGAGVGDPYGQQPPPNPYGQQPDYYGTPDAYPPPRPQRQRTAEPGPDPDTGWDPGPDEGEHAFFADRDEDDDDDEPPTRGGRRSGRSRRGSVKRKSGCACMVVALVLTGGVGTGAYYGYTFYNSHFADAPDYAGQGTGEVHIEIPPESTVSQMGNILKREGVVKSHDAFVAAARNNTKAQTIQAGTYVLRKEMSAAAALTMMLDPASQSGLIIPEGMRASAIYKLIDEKTESPAGTTKKAAKSANLALPEWAGGKVEGFLFPAKYSVGKKTEPKAVLKEMVKRSKAEFKKVESDAKKVGLTPFEVLTVASLIQAEAQDDEDFGKVSRVVYNRLKPDNTATNGKLDFDSTINYALGRSTLDVTVNDTKLKSPYNTYRHPGLPPGPIGNPGHQAIDAALNPTKGDWLYFVTVKPGDTRFSVTLEEHNEHVREFNEEQRKKRENDG
ncbi:endolytic transglycosylase MltG [Streptomyces gobiensis]|uniref:endolytic transglycosylase MltG n=1 Tax=Streptomyces gobiensis TaxID=2875706 RepID=UPI001E485922|nr:endolytic transglycosylase MltG [Streptomyces gobiensis]UGY90383.1 endolytic transglycosylase MltG [Streptomyces gobiensis]